MNSSNQFHLAHWLRSPSGLVFLAFLAIAAFYRITEHTANIHLYYGTRQETRRLLAAA